MINPINKTLTNNLGFTYALIWAAGILHRLDDNHRSHDWWLRFIIFDAPYGRAASDTNTKGRI